MMENKMRQKIKAIFWDLDGTLINSEAIHEQAAFFATQELGITSRVNVIPAGLENTAVFELMTGINTGTKKHNLLERWNELAIEYALTRIEAEHKIPQSLELFNYFSLKNLPQSVVSNSNAPIVQHSLERLGIITKCRQIFSRDSVELGKPHPQLYLNALASNQYNANECLTFEDSHAGITAAKSCGINVIGIGLNTLQYSPNLACDLATQSWLEQIQDNYCFD